MHVYEFLPYWPSPPRQVVTLPHVVENLIYFMLAISGNAVEFEKRMLVPGPEYQIR